MISAEEIKSAIEDVFWRDNDARISENGKKVTMMVENWERECSDDPYAYEFEFDLNEMEFTCTGHGGNGRNWGTPYYGGLNTYEKVRYACECAYEHNWRHWGA